MQTGRPLKYNTPEDMQKIIDQYFSDCYANWLWTNVKDHDEPENPITYDRHPTITGLGLVLDLTRQSLINYEGRPEFLDTIKKAKARVEAYNEQRLHDNNVTGVIFNLKNNFGWKDKQEVDTNLSGSIETKETGAVDAIKQFLATKSSG